MADIDKQIENMYMMQYRQIPTDKLESILKTTSFTVRIIERVLKERKQSE